MNTILKNPSTYYFLIIIGLIAYIFLRPTTSPNDAKIAADERKYDSLQVIDQRKLDSVKSYYNDKIDSVNIKILDAQNQILENNLLIKSLKDAYIKEIPVINSYDVDALRVYFSNYKQQSDTTTNVR